MKKDFVDPPTPTDVPKMIKKSAINWMVPTFLGVTCLAFLALADSHFQSMLDKYQTKQQATELETEHNNKENRIEEKLDLMDKKLDHLQYVFDYNQEHPKVYTPKQKEP